ncbi:MAG TPA: ABC transporter permease [Steroidobacteraceae bacterium]|nr:ABC transporter permease [Steroidobacteraceae bacterium]
MKLLPLVWAGIWRKPARSIFTALSIAIAFVLIGLLQGVNAGFAQAIAAAARDFLITNVRVRGSPPMPIAMLEQIRAVPGVVEVVPRAYFVGIYRPPYDVAALATEPRRFFALRPALVIEPKYLDEIERVRTGLLATPALLRLYDWKVGDLVTLRSRALKRDGSGDWDFTIVGTFDSKDDPNTAIFGVINYSYFDATRVADRGTAELFYVHIRDATRSVATAAAIDRLFANSPHETRTRSDQERAEANTKQMGDIAYFTNAILGAVLFALLLLTGNTMRQSIQERIPEFGVLKAMGYSSAQCFALALAEALAIYLLAALAGLAVASLLAPLGREVATAIRVSGDVVVRAIALAVLLAFLSVALPSWRVYRISVVAALAARRA